MKSGTALEQGGGGGGTMSGEATPWSAHESFDAGPGN